MSTTALVNLRRTAAEGGRLPDGCFRGGNLALLVEVLAAGLTGAAWSLDAAGREGGKSPWDAGLFVLAIDPGDPAGFAGRLAL